MYRVNNFWSACWKITAELLRKCNENLFTCLYEITKFDNSFSKNGFIAEVSNFTTASKNAAKKFKNHSR